MNKVLIIIRRELLNRIGKKSFIILTVLMPFIFAAVILVPLWLASIKDGSQEHVVIVDQTGRYAPLFRSNERFAFSVAPQITDSMRQAETDIDAVLYFSGDLAVNPKAAVIYSREEVPFELTEYVNSQLGRFLQRQRLSRYQLDHVDINKLLADANTDFSIQTFKWDEHGNEVLSDANAAALAGMVLVLFIYMFILSYGGMVMQSVMEEKTNRIVEIMVSSVRPFQLMMGKMVGIALAGFVQLIVWGLMLGVIMLIASVAFGVNVGLFGGMPEAAALTAGAAPAAPSELDAIMTPLLNLPLLEMGLMFVLYFIGAYLLYASFFAAVGASVNEQEDSSQFMSPVIILLLFGLYAAIYGIQNPDGPLCFWASLFPLTSPIVMMARIPFGVPLWQEVLSLALLYLSVAFMVWAAGKIYRVGILMYGKKPSFKEMIRWMRYK